MPLIPSIRSFLPSFATQKTGQQTTARQPAEIELSVPPHADAGVPAGGIRTYSHHATAALALLRGDKEPPLEDLLCSDAPSDRSAALHKLEALVAPGGPVSVLDGHGAAADTLRQLHQQACADQLPPPDVLRQSLSSVNAQLDSMATVPGEPGAAAAAIKVVLAGKAGKTTADLLNSFRGDDRIAGNARLDELLQHLQVLSRMHLQQDPGQNPGQLPDGSTPAALPDALAVELRQLILSAGHAVLPERRDALLACRHLGLPVASWFDKCDTLTRSASHAMTALRTRPGAATGQPGREYPPPSGNSFAKVGQMAKAARNLAVTAAPHPNRSRQSAHYRIALRGPLAALVRDMSPQEAAELYRRLKEPECLSLRAMAARALWSRQQLNEGSSAQATLLAAEREQLEDWLAAYDMLLGTLEDYLALDPQAAAAAGVPAQRQPRADPAAPAGTEAAEPPDPASVAVLPEQHARAQEMFKTTFGFGVDPAPAPAQASGQAPAQAPAQASDQSSAPAP